jgi:hypothetical protein
VTNEEAAQMLAQLSEHFGEAVRPTSFFCQQFHAWLKAMIAWEEGGGDEWTSPEDSKRKPDRLYRRFQGAMHAATQKSHLLGRLMADGEKLRMTKCPAHQGRQDTAMVVGILPSGEQLCVCHGTGWLPEGAAPIEFP